MRKCATPPNRNQGFPMIRSLRQFAAVLAVSLGVAVPASATVYSTDFTDLWFNVNEEGWGFNVIQQGNTLFGTLFVYGNDQTARWFVASDMKPLNTTPGQFAFTGKLYQTTGPFFGAGTFNESLVGVTEVGDITIFFTTTGTATLNYNVGANAVTKQITRQTFVNNTPAGVFIGGMTGVLSACSNSGNNGLFANFVGDVTGAINGSTATFRIDTIQNNQLTVCNFSGQWSQQGRLATVANGIWSCTNVTGLLNNGTFSLSEVDVQVNGMTARSVATDQFCTYTGRFGGIRNVGTQ